MSNRNSPNPTMATGQQQEQPQHDQSSRSIKTNNGASLHQKSDSSSSRVSNASSQNSSSLAAVAAAAPSSDTLILLTPYPVEPGHTLITIARLSATEWKPEMRSSAAYVAEGDNAGIIINKPASIMDYNKVQAGQKERQQPPSAKMSFKVFLINSETNKLALEHRTLRFWLDHSPLISQHKATKNNGSRTTTTTTLATGGDNDETNNEENLVKSMRSFTNLKQESSQLAQAYFCQLIGSRPDDFPKNYVGFIMKLMRLLKGSQFARIIKMEVELRQLALEDQSAKPPSPVSSIDGSQSGRGSPLTSQKVLDIIESSYPNPISVREICSSTQTDEPIVRQLVDELASKEKISSTDEGQHYTRTTKPIDTKVQMVKQMPKVTRSQQPVIAIITAQYCEKLAVDSMISDKETFVRYRVSAAGQDSGVESSSNYVYTLGNIGDHRVVSTKLTSIGHSRGALIAAGNATTRLLGTFPEIEYVFMVGCGGGVANYTDFSSHVRLGDIVVSHLPSTNDDEDFVPQSNDANLSRHIHYAASGSKSSAPSSSDFVYVHCRPKLQEQGQKKSTDRAGANIPVSYSIHRNLKRGGGGSTLNGINNNNSDITEESKRDESSNNNNNNKVAPDGEGDTSMNQSSSSNNNNNNMLVTDKQLTYEECHFRLWRPAKLDLQELAQRLWFQGLENAKHRIWDYYIDDGIKTLKQQDIEASRPTGDTDKLYMSIGMNDTIEVSHPEAGEDEVDLRREGRPMCHFGPIGSGRPAVGANEKLKQQMISEFNLRAFDSEFDPVVESIYGNCKESYIMIRGISDYKDGRKKKEWQQYSALVAAAFMKSIIVNLKPLN